MKSLFLATTLILVGCAKMFADISCSTDDVGEYAECMHFAGYDLPTWSSDAQKQRAYEREVATFCATYIRNGWFDTAAACSKFLAEAKSCEASSPKADEVKKCLWRLEHPVETGCEEQAQAHGGGYWECVKIGYEHMDRTRQLRVEANRAQRENQLIYRATEAERQAAEAIIIRDLQRIQPVNCVTNTVGGQTFTSCH